MSYQVFARKYRPQIFDDVLGQDHVVQTLKNAITQNRLAHAYLFVGPRGTGKTSTARILAKALNCVHGPTVSPCGVCDSCREIAQGISLDVLEIDGASNNSVDQVRELRENVRFAPVRGPYKIYITDEVHMLTSQAFNALLKTLEEPPAHVIFIFATTEPNRVLPTILSRCQRFDLRRIPTQIIARHLAFIAQKENVTLTADAAEAIAVAADGGLRDAESMLDQLVAFCGKQIAESQVLEVFGLTSEHLIADLVRSILKRDAPKALSLIYEQASAGRDLTRMLTDLLGFLRNLLVYQVDAANLREELSEQTQSALHELRNQVETRQVLQCIEQFSAAEATLRLSSNKKLHLEIAVIRAIQSLEEVGLETVLEALEQLQGASPMSPPSNKATTLEARPVKAKLPRTGVPPEVPTKRAPAKEGAPEASAGSAPANPAAVADRVGNENQIVSPPLSLSELWPRFLEEVRRHRPLLASSIQAAVPLELNDQALLLGFGPQNSLELERLSRPNHVQFLTARLQELTRDARVVKLELRAEEPRLEHAPAVAEIPVPSFRNEPMIQKALEIFRAEIEASD